MGKTEELYKKVRSQLDNLGYLQPVSVHSLFLVEKLLDDLEHVTTKFHHYKIVAEESIQVDLNSTYYYILFDRVFDTVCMIE